MVIHSTCFYMISIILNMMNMIDTIKLIGGIPTLVMNTFSIRLTILSIVAYPFYYIQNKKGKETNNDIIT